MILFPAVDTKANYLGAFWRWVELLEKKHYQYALEALQWPDGPSWTAEHLKRHITTYWEGDKPWSVVVPNERLVRVVNDAAEFEPPGHNPSGWFLVQIPVTTRPDDPKNGAIPLMGVAVSFFVRRRGDRYALELEIFHA
ncbi:MAG: hypothetical protein AAGI68_07945 [Planctomycetota bacterium]